MGNLPSTTVGVRYLRQLPFEGANPGLHIWEIEMIFDGPTPDGTVEIRFPGGATAATKRNAVRAIVNRELKANEPNTPALTDAVIQISGQPV